PVRASLFQLPRQRTSEQLVEPQQLVRSWLNGRARLTEGTVRFHESTTGSRAEKFRRAYDWIVTRALIAPYRDVDFGNGPVTGLETCRVHLPGATGYASFVLLPLLHLL